MLRSVTVYDVVDAKLPEIRVHGPHDTPGAARLTRYSHALMPGVPGSTHVRPTAPEPAAAISPFGVPSTRDQAPATVPITART